MIDSTNPRILANNIRKLFAMVKAIVPGTVVEGNPTGSGYTNLLKKIKIGSSKYKLPDEVTANPEGEATGSLTKIGIGDAILNVAAPVNIKSGIVDFGSISGSGSKTKAVTFDEAFADTNYAVIMTWATPSSQGFASAGYGAIDLLTTGFTAKLYATENLSSTAAYKMYWIAIPYSEDYSTPTE